MKQNTSDYAATIGLDWADQKHDYCLQVSGSDELEYGTFCYGASPSSMLKNKPKNKHI